MQNENNDQGAKEFWKRLGYLFDVIGVEVPGNGKPLYKCIDNVNDAIGIVLNLKSILQSKPTLKKNCQRCRS